MTFTFRRKLALLVGIAAFALFAVALGSIVLGMERSEQLDDVEARLVPKVAEGRAIHLTFERLQQALQRAVVARDREALSTSAATRDELLGLLSRTDALTREDAAEASEAVRSYDAAARTIAQRLLAGETGEKVQRDLAALSAQRAETRRVLDDTTRLSRNELASGFQRLRAAAQTADRFRLLVGALGFILLLGASLWISRRLIKSVTELSQGISRVAEGRFGEPIVLVGSDELADVGRTANAMAESLSRLEGERERSDWLKTGLANLSDELRGETEPQPLAQHALDFLAERAGAHAGALYLADEERSLVFTAGYAAGAPSVNGDRHPRQRFGLGEGLVGQAARRDELSVVEDVPSNYLTIESGLGRRAPCSLVLLPVSHLGEPQAVIELAFLSECAQKTREFLNAVRAMLGVTIASAKANAKTRELLARTREQAQLLAAQEEELRVSNQELQAQQEELRCANEELESQREALSEHNTELQSAQRMLEQKNDELARVSRFKSQFLANMSHELRTPLNSMLLLSHLMAENDSGNLTEKQLLHVKTIHSAGQDLLKLINQILDLAKIEAGRQSANFAPIAISHFVEHARRVAEALATDKGLALSIEAEPGLPVAVVTDVQRVEGILTNLLGNAVKFTERGKVSLHLYRPASTSELSRESLRGSDVLALVVSDTGVGISPEERERIFAPFEQLEARSDRRHGGTGLGLAIARESAELIGGELRVESTPGRGSTFTCYIPLLEAKAEPSAPPLRAQAKGGGGPPRLLVIEDDVVFARELGALIESRQFSVATAQTGEEGLKLARELKPVGIVLDVRLPDIDGWNVMRRLQEDPATSRIPVHFLSGVDEAERGMLLGAVGYLTKPASHDDLLNVIRALTPVPTQRPPRVLVVEDNAVQGQTVVELFANEEMDVTHVLNAEAALEATRERQYQCLVLDLGLPDLGGLELLERLQERGQDPAPAVVVHTGRALTRQETQRLEAYADAVVLKDGSSAKRLVEEVRLFVHHLERRVGHRERPLPPARVAGEDGLSGLCVLVAEDDMRTAYAVSALLRSKGAEVLIATTGHEALDTLNEHPEVDCVLMDVMMPEMDGYEAMRLLRKESRYEKLPVIALTAKAMRDERARCIAAGASDYLTKPVNAALLLSALRACLSTGARDA